MYFSDSNGGVVARVFPSLANPIGTLVQQMLRESQCCQNRICSSEPNVLRGTLSIWRPSNLVLPTLILVVSHSWLERTDVHRSSVLQLFSSSSQNCSDQRSSSLVCTSCTPLSTKTNQLHQFVCAAFGSRQPSNEFRGVQTSSPHNFVFHSGLRWSLPNLARLCSNPQC